MPYLERFSLAIVDTVLAETTCGHGTSDFHSWSPVLVNQITEQCPQLALPPYPVGYNATDPRITWYGRPDLLFKVMEHYGVDAFGRTPEALANALDLLPDWHAASSS